MLHIMRAIVIIFFLTCLTDLASGQDNVNVKEMVGFGCYYAGQPLEAVIKLTNMLHEKKYNDISDLLKSGNGAEKYLAVISLEKLSNIGQYQLSQPEKDLIEKIRKSKQKVSVCSGCMYFDKVSMKSMFSEDNFLGSNWWIEETLKSPDEDLPQEKQ
jgi:hypothetical protein